MRAVGGRSGKAGSRLPARRKAFLRDSRRVSGLFPGRFRAGSGATDATGAAGAKFGNESIGREERKPRSPAVVGGFETVVNTTARAHFETFRDVLG